jgi:hypothetical protein
MTTARKRKIWIGVFGAAVIGLGVGSKWFSYVQYRELQQQIGLARAEGLPLEPADLRLQRLSPSENAETPMLRAWALSHSRCLTAFKAFNKTFLSDNRSGYREFSRGDDRVLEQLQPVISSWRDAARQPKLDFHRNWEEGPRMALDFDDIRSGVIMLVGDADRRDRLGHTHDGTLEFQDAARLAALPDRDPTLVGCIMANACEAIVESALEASLWRSRIVPGISERVKSVIAAMGPLPSLRHALSGELVLERQEISVLANTNFRDWAGRGGMTASLRLSKLETVRVAYDGRLLESWRVLFGSLPRDESDMKGTGHALANWEEWLDRQTDWSFDFVHIVSPDYSGLAMSLKMQLSLRRVLTTLSELLELKAAGKQFGGELSATPDHMDPFTDKPLHVRAKPGGWMVYSVGPDGVDQDGNRIFDFGRTGIRPNVVAEYPALRPPTAKDRRLPDHQFSGDARSPFLRLPMRAR